MITGYIDHNEAVIRHFIEDKEFADLYLQSVLQDGDFDEINEVQSWYNEAKSRTASMGYWGAVVDNAEKTAKDGKNIDLVISLVKKALNILQSAHPTEA